MIAEHSERSGMRSYFGLPDPSLNGRVSSGGFGADGFGRMLPDAPALYTDPRHLAAIGASDGPMAQQGSAGKASKIPAGHIFFGQFIGNDMTGNTGDAAVAPRAGTPRLDLSCIYGDGPAGSPHLYFSGQGTFDGIKLLTGADQPDAFPYASHDLMRNPHGRAIIGHPRNDENRVISQLQLAMIRFHNIVCDRMAVDCPDKLTFEPVRRCVTWHYQWTVVNDFLQALVGPPMLADIFGRGRRLYRPEDTGGAAADGSAAFIPLEFAVAAYRFCHSMIPARLQIQPEANAIDLFGNTAGYGFSPVQDIDAVVVWRQMLDLSDPASARANRLDAALAAELLELPFGEPHENSLATHNLLGGQACRLPSGEYVARLCERSEKEISWLSDKAKSLAAEARPAADLSAGTPLWLYVLIEAAEVGPELRADHISPGEGLGPVGGRIVAETIIGLLELDSNSWLGGDRNWSPAHEEHPLCVTSLLEMLTH